MTSKVFDKLINSRLTEASIARYDSSVLEYGRFCFGDHECELRHTAGDFIEYCLQFLIIWTDMLGTLDN